jgi:hypothetical protein
VERLSPHLRAIARHAARHLREAERLPLERPRPSRGLPERERLHVGRRGAQQERDVVLDVGGDQRRLPGITRLSLRVTKPDQDVRPELLEPLGPARHQASDAVKRREQEVLRDQERGPTLCAHEGAGDGALLQVGNGHGPGAPCARGVCAGVRLARVRPPRAAWSRLRSMLSKGSWRFLKLHPHRRGALPSPATPGRLHSAQRGSHVGGRAGLCDRSCFRGDFASRSAKAPESSERSRPSRPRTPRALPSVQLIHSRVRE